MYELTNESVLEVFNQCLSESSQITDDTIQIEGILSRYLFSRHQITKNADRIKAMLAELPEEFRADCGGGWSFLQACYRKDKSQWTGEHRIMEQLLALGMASENVRCQMPREFWPVLPGGMPYYQITLDISRKPTRL